MSSEACVTIATGDWGSGQASGLIAIAAGSGDAKGAVEAVLTDDASDVGEGTNVFVAAPGASATANKTPMTVSKAVTTKANEILRSLERRNILTNKKIEKQDKKQVEGQFDMYNYKLAEIAHEVDKINLNELTPIDALNTLVKIKEKIK